MRDCDWAAPAIAPCVLVRAQIKAHRVTTLSARTVTNITLPPYISPGAHAQNDEGKKMEDTDGEKKDEGTSKKPEERRSLNNRPPVSQ